MSNWKKLLLLLGAGLVLAVVVAAAVRGLSAPSVEVRTALVEHRSYEDKVLTTGKLEVAGAVDLVAHFPGRLLKLHVDEGDRVAEGQLLFELDTFEQENRVREAEAALKVAEAELARAQNPASPGEIAAAEAEYDWLQSQAENARRNYERHRYLFEQGAVPAAEFEAAEASYKKAEADLQAAASRLERLRSGDPEEIRVIAARVEQARATLQSARALLEKGQLRAPGGGVVLQKYADEGDYLQPGSPVLTIGDPENLQVVADLSEQDVAGVTPGQEVEVRWAGDPGKVYRGEVARVAPSVTRGTMRENEYVVKVYITLKEAGTGLKPGANVDLTIYRVKPRRSLLVPNEAVVELDGKKAVFVVEGRTARRRAVDVGHSNELYTEIKSGVKAGELVVLAPEGLQDGQQVRVSTGDGK